MSKFIDIDFINRISYSLEGFKWLRGNLGLCRCPICGDSKKSKHKKRFYFYQPIVSDSLADYIAVSCKNCGYASSFYHFLQDYDISTFDEYKMELFKENSQGKDWKEVAKKLSYKPKADEFTQKEIQKLKEIEHIPLLDGCIRLTDLPPDHLCILYLKSRKMPDIAYRVLQYTDNFKSVAKSFTSILDVTEHLPENEARLVIPFVNRRGETETIQGRSLDKKSGMRYITIKKAEESSKLFGYERLDYMKPIYVVEAPLDSLFLPNCIAVADANLVSCGIENAILIPDKQFRNREICKYVDRFIEMGYAVVLFPNDFCDKSKDINEYIQYGATIDLLMKVIRDNSFTGMRAKLELAKRKMY